MKNRGGRGKGVKRRTGRHKRTHTRTHTHTYTYTHTHASCAVRTYTHDHGRFHQLIARTKPPAVAAVGGWPQGAGRRGRACVYTYLRFYIFHICIYMRMYKERRRSGGGARGSRRNPFGRRHVPAGTPDNCRSKRNRKLS